MDAGEVISEDSGCSRNVNHDGSHSVRNWPVHSHVFYQGIDPPGVGTIPKVPSASGITWCKGR